MPTLTWYERYPHLFDEERETLLQQGFSLEQVAIQQHKLVKFTGTIQFEGESFNILIEYPKAFPHFPPNAYCQNVQFQRHQDVQSKRLCLYEEWKDLDFEVFGHNIVERIKEWLHGYKYGFSPDSEINGPEPKQYHQLTSGFRGIILTPRELIDNWSFSEAVFSMRIARLRDIWQGILVDISGAGNTIQAQPIHQELYKNYPVVHGMCFDVNSTPPYFHSGVEIVQWLEAHGHENVLQKCISASHHLQDQNSMFGPLLGIRFIDEDELRGQTRRRFMIVAIDFQNQFQNPNSIRVTPMCIFESKDISEEVVFRRVAELRPLQNMSAVIVGLGTIGSSIALDLAKAGIGKVALVDHGSLDVGNVVRHVGNLQQLGQLKIEAVTAHMKSHNPYIEIQEIPTYVGAFQDEEVLTNWISSADILICAVGHSPTERYLDRIARQSNTPTVYTFSSSGAWSGRAFRVIPGTTGCYHCHQYFIDDGTLPPLSAPPEELVIFDNGCAIPAFPGSGLDTGIVSNLASRLAIQTLLVGHPNAYEPTQNDHIVWYSRGKNGNLEIVQKSVGKHAHCKWC
ncbi:ThiF family adenylyltransferase [Ferroacidibacillus organovorans]|uniref:THIF-type NAD/FAD binding fold domain-containing protein n=1 Tax=Ferroacidibacillus organovorans TaxID=1765683 RepID=A0A124IW30_9BACL|nr:ThiF family adenylyltransferase [Ferroacidibacillus organovorans]KUO96124.1 hypothetical protein ATW55_14420 [Ferroacidibacillus organovorans]